MPSTARRVAIGLLAGIAAALLLPAPAHALEVTRGPYAGDYPDRQEEWMVVWADLVTEAGGIDDELLWLRGELYDLERRWTPWLRARRAAERQLTIDMKIELWADPAADGAERWRRLVERYFEPDDVPWALRVMDCESRGDPWAKNPSSSASGLFQHLARFWPKRSLKAGWAGSSIFDPQANVAVAAWLFYDGGGKRHWVCKG